MNYNPAYLDGTLTAINDIRLGRWDCDNVIPPARHMTESAEWMRGYMDTMEDFAND